MSLRFFLGIMTTNLVKPSRDFDWQFVGIVWLYNHTGCICLTFLHCVKIYGWGVACVRGLDLWRLSVICRWAPCAALQYQYHTIPCNTILGPHALPCKPQARMAVVSISHPTFFTLVRTNHKLVGASPSWRERNGFWKECGGNFS